MKPTYLVLTTCILLAGLAQAQSRPDTALSGPNKGISKSLLQPPSGQPHTAGHPYVSAPAQRYECSASFTLELCKQGMAVLKRVLARYWAPDLQQWKWILVHSEDWSHILLAHGIRPAIPAMTILDKETTLFDEALVIGPAGRTSELMDIWHLGREALLDLAVRHELGHALCNDSSERNADRIARLLEQRKPVACERKHQLKPNSENLHKQRLNPGPLQDVRAGSGVPISRAMTFPVRSFVSGTRLAR
jgi:hypothetical protein